MAQLAVSLFVIILFLCSVSLGQYCNYHCNITAGITCNAPCSACINNICSCPNNLAICSMRSSMYQCYNSTTELCCPQYLSHGNGVICTAAQTCCQSFSILTCNDPTTSFCCPYAAYAASCKFSESCCGSSYPFCIDTRNRQCCCSSFACPVNNTCNCTASQCIPPLVCGSGICATGELCCNDMLSGSQCYNTSMYSCVQGSGGMRLCLPGYAACNSTCYNPNQYTCFSGNKLCPVPLLPCGDACYDTTKYKCVNGKLQPV